MTVRLKDMTTKLKRGTGLNFLRGLQNLVNVNLEGKVPFELRPYFFLAKLIALETPDGGLRPIAVGNTFRRLSAKCAGCMSSNHVSQDTEANK